MKNESNNSEMKITWNWIDWRYRTRSGRKRTEEEPANTRPTACDRQSTPCPASAAPSVCCTTATPTPRVISPRSLAPAPAAVWVRAAAVAITAAAASTRPPSGGSVWPCSHWSYPVSGATCPYAPATDAGSSADVAANLTKPPDLSTKTI